MKELIIAVLLINALFWGLMPHSIHCDVMAKVTTIKCPPHIFHILFGIGSFLLAVILSQSDYFTNIYNNLSSATQTAGRIALTTCDSLRQISKNSNGIEDFAKNIENFVTLN